MLKLRLGHQALKKQASNTKMQCQVTEERDSQLSKLDQLKLTTKY